MKSTIRVSLVIPVYNEESHLRLCLDAIAAQTVRPFEVIVVDNNSTDGTVAVASEYPFVTVLHERRQGVAYARDCGFNAARGDVIGRTDGDTILAPDWVETVQRVFADPDIDAASGIVAYRDIGLKGVFGRLDTLFRTYLSRRMGAVQEVFLYGVTMAIRRTAWQSVRAHVCHERRFAEDMDLAAHMSRLGQNVLFAPTMQATISPRQAASSPREFYKYVWSCPRTYGEHAMVTHRYMYPIAIFVLVCYVPIRLLYRGYDPSRQRFSWVYLRRSAVQPRVSPVSDLI
jgi:glycosyltransferase involved in cell wall biosynthesis